MHVARVLIALFASCVFVLAGAVFDTNTRVSAQETIGTAIPVANEEGVTVGSITVSEVIDPFMAFDPAYPAEAGSRFVVAQVVFDADAGQRFDITPWTIVLQDVDGFLWDMTSVYLPDDALIPELTSQTLAPGSRVTGLVGFSIPEDAVPARIFYQPVSSRLILLAELVQASPPVVGDAVEVADAEGGVGLVSVTDVVDPFEDVDPGTALPEGGRYVLVTLRYENPGEGRFFSEPYGLLLRDANGDLWSTTYINRLDVTELVPDLNRVQLAPGDRISGAVVYAVPADVPLTGLYLSPTSDQLIELAVLADEDSVEDVPDATEESGVVVSDESAAIDPCTDFNLWLIDTQARMLRAQELSAEVSAAEDPAEVADLAAEFAGLADVQSATIAPEGAEAVNKAFLVTLRALAVETEHIARSDAGSSGMTEGLTTIDRATQRLGAIEMEMGAVGGDCALA